jgi:hypothetical protein
MPFRCCVAYHSGRPAVQVEVITTTNRRLRSSLFPRALGLTSEGAPAIRDGRRGARTCHVMADTGRAGQ